MGSSHVALPLVSGNPVYDYWLDRGLNESDSLAISKGIKDPGIQSRALAIQKGITPETNITNQTIGEQENNKDLMAAFFWSVLLMLTGGSVFLLMALFLLWGSSR